MDADQLRAMKRENFACNLDLAFSVLPAKATPGGGAAMPLEAGVPVERCDREGVVETVCVPLDVRSARAMLGHMTVDKSGVVKQFGPMPGVLEGDQEQFDAVKQALGRAMQSLAEGCPESSGFIVKLSSRSPKDASLAHPKFRELYEKSLAALHSISGYSAVPCDTKLVALYTAAKEVTCVHNVDEAMALLLASKRICFDLSLDLKFPEEFSLKIVVRPWVNIPMWGEFRAFVNNNKMTALSQYFSQLFFPELTDGARCAALRDTIMQFFETHVQPHTSTLAGGKYSVDFIVDASNNVSILEFNPFMISTSSCLFDWSNEKDDKIMHGELPFEFRVHKTSLVDVPGAKAKMSSSLPPDWVTLIFTE